MFTENIITETVQGNIKLVRYNNPKKKNALDILMYQTIAKILKEVSRDENISVVVLTGTGDFYSSGNDLSAIKNSGPGILYSALREFIRSIIEFPKILVAIVNGPAVGIAVTTLALCDVVFASESSYFYTPFTKLGIVPEGCSTFTFSRIMGEKKALEMLLFNYKMPAREALQYGFINDIYKPEELQKKVWDRIIEITNIRSEALIAGKKLIRDQYKNHLLELNDTELKLVFDLQSLSKL